MVSFEEIRERVSGRPSAASWNWLVRVAMLDYDDRSAPREAAMDYILGRIERWPSRLRSMSSELLFELCFGAGVSSGRTDRTWGERAAWLPTRLRIEGRHLAEFRLREEFGEWGHLRDQIEHIDLALGSSTIDPDDGAAAVAQLEWLVDSWMAPKIERLVLGGGPYYAPEVREALVELLAVEELAPRALVGHLPASFYPDDLFVRMPSVRHARFCVWDFLRHELWSREVGPEHLSFEDEGAGGALPDLDGLLLQRLPTSLHVHRHHGQPFRFYGGLRRGAYRKLRVLGFEVRIDDPEGLEHLFGLARSYRILAHSSLEHTKVHTLALSPVGGAPRRFVGDMRRTLEVVARGVSAVYQLRRLVLPRQPFERFFRSSARDPVATLLEPLARADVELCLEESIADYDSWTLEPLMDPGGLEPPARHGDAPLQGEYAWASERFQPFGPYEPDLAAFRRVWRA
jgi:hypothetical protein